MKVVIAMAGPGDRFLESQNTDIVPMIEVDGRPMVSHVVDLYPGETDFVFLCRKDHLDRSDLGKVLSGLRPGAPIIAVKRHDLGPVETVLKADGFINDDESVLVSHCDFSAWWDYPAFKRFVAKSRCDGCILTCSGFHPHLIGPGRYAGLRIDDRGRALEIREKHAFVKDPRSGHWSAGAYWFRRWRDARSCMRRAMDECVPLDGGVYVSMAVQLLIDDGLDIRTWDLDYFLHWGNPVHLAAYRMWAKYFKAVRGRQT
ncbi:MAG: hypothetical protein GXP54_06110 [Deltaproteobacteria bacterium]|nr:hypothetical protein [Deltaproteobacteria bacterium]